MSMVEQFLALEVEFENMVMSMLIINPVNYELLGFNVIKFASFDLITLVR